MKTVLVVAVLLVALPLVATAPAMAQPEPPQCVEFVPGTCCTSSTWCMHPCRTLDFIDFC